MLLELAALAAVVAVALALRLPELDEPTDNYDEGAYLASLLLMRHGYHPFADINTGEGPLNLYLAYVSYALGGFTLSAARTGTVVASLLGLGGVAWAGRALGGPVAGVAAALALALSPTFLRVSRWVGPEAAAVALAALAVGAAAWAYRTDRDRWRLLAGALFALANLIQASVPMAALAVGLLTVKRSAPRSALLAPAMAVAVVVGVLLAVGPVEVLGRIVSWRLGGQQLDPSPAVLGHNANMLLDKMFRQEQPAMYALAAVGWLGLVRRAPRAGLALGGWLAAQLALLLAYTELSSHLGVTLLGPMVLLAGLGIGVGWRLVARSPRPRRAELALSGAAALLAIWYAASMPALIARDQRQIAGELTTDRPLGRDERAAVRAIARLTDADDFVLTDAPYLAFLADRMVPPPLVDPSTSRINAGALTAEQVIAALRDYDPEVVVLWTGKLARFEPVVRAIARNFSGSCGAPFTRIS